VSPSVQSPEGDPLTDSVFWDRAYEDRVLEPFNGHDWRNYAAVQIVRAVRAIGLDGKRICEVGGGDGQLSAYMARLHPSASFSVIDYSEKGCALARRRSLLERVALHVHQQDVFEPDGSLLGVFDVVMSFGVVEHFRDLPGVLAAKRRLLKPGGVMFTLIPNFAGSVYASLCKRWSRSVFDDHVPHDMKSLTSGHVAAGLVPKHAAYIGSTEFGMLSMAMSAPEKKSRVDYQLYLGLTRVSKALHYFEWKIVDLPSTRFFSPYIFVVSSAPP
jgi:2-polyprenyl-3-methyl-5-hydroxy-6-metoxy-1,4-benzoquinol methylase